MTTLVDTSVWSLALRRAVPDGTSLAYVHRLQALLEDASVVMIGPIRQELLSGISSEAQFVRLRDRLAILPDEAILPEDYVTAATFWNLCRQHGIQGSHIDFLICAVAVRNKWPLLTTDVDFTRYAAHVPIDLDQGSG